MPKKGRKRISQAADCCLRSGGESFLAGKAVHVGREGKKVERRIGLCGPQGPSEEGNEERGGRYYSRGKIAPSIERGKEGDRKDNHHWRSKSRRDEVGGGGKKEALSLFHTRVSLAGKHNDPGKEKKKGQPFEKMGGGQVPPLWRGGAWEQGKKKDPREGASERRPRPTLIATREKEGKGAALKRKSGLHERLGEKEGERKKARSNYTNHGKEFNFP